MKFTLASMSPLEAIALKAVQVVVFTALGAAGGALLSSLGGVVGHPVDPGTGAYVGMGLYLLRFVLI
jgi:hypothetical protein